jgi:hypothetical protein
VPLESKLIDEFDKSFDTNSEQEVLDNGYCPYYYEQHLAVEKYKKQSIEAAELAKHIVKMDKKMSSIIDSGTGDVPITIPASDSENWTSDEDIVDTGNERNDYSVIKKPRESEPKMGDQNAA